jgi:hypothetical protein
MSGGGANVGSIDAIRHFRAVLHTFSQEAREALSSYDVEVQRTLDWLLDEMPQRWKAEIRKCDELVQKAKIELERCRATPLPGGGTPSCMQEKKDYDRAKQRKQYAEEKAEATRKWGHVAQREAAEYMGRSNQLASQFDADLPTAILLLDRVMTSLEAYRAYQFQAAELRPTGVPSTDAATTSVGNPAAVEAPAEKPAAAEVAAPGADPQLAGAGQSPAAAPAGNPAAGN